jgi:hypothetical protein
MPQISSVSEIEFWAPYVVDGRSLFACILRFEDAKTDYSDTLSGCPLSPPFPLSRPLSRLSPFPSMIGVVALELQVCHFVANAFHNSHVPILRVR